MLRGSLSIWSAFFAIIFLKRRFHAYQWIGLVFTVLSMIIIGIAGVQMSGFGTNYDWTDRLVGVILILGGQVLQGGQLVWDETMLTRFKLPVLLVVGMEGVWGMVIEIVIGQWFTFIFPGNDPSPLGGSLEYWGDTMISLSHSWKLVVIGIASVISIGAYDCSGMTVTARASAVHRTIFEALRTATTWVAMLLIELFAPDYGERWEVWSWLELGGFVLLVFSSLVFNDVLRIPCIQYPVEMSVTIDESTLSTAWKSEDRPV
jgi:hypothetical protein